MGIIEIDEMTGLTILKHFYMKNNKIEYQALTVSDNLSNFKV